MCIFPGSGRDSPCGGDASSRILCLSLKLSVPAQDYVGAVQAAITAPEVQGILKGQNVLMEVRDGEKSSFVAVQGGSAAPASGGSAADIVVSGSSSAFLSVMNSPNQASALMRAISDGVIAVNAKDPVKQAVIKAAIKSGLLKAPRLSGGLPLGSCLRISVGG